MYLLGARRGYSGADLKALLDRSLKPVGMILLVIACGGVIRWMLQDCGLGQVIGPMLEASPLPLVVVAFLIAVMVRASVGIGHYGRHACGCRSLSAHACRYLSCYLRRCHGPLARQRCRFFGCAPRSWREKTTLKSWTIMETLIGLSGLACALVISFFA